MVRAMAIREKGEKGDFRLFQNSKTAEKTADCLPVLYHPSIDIDSFQNDSIYHEH